MASQSIPSKKTVSTSAWFLTAVEVGEQVDVLLWKSGERFTVKRHTRKEGSGPVTSVSLQGTTPSQASSQPDNQIKVTAYYFLQFKEPISQCYLPCRFLEWPRIWLPRGARHFYMKNMTSSNLTSWTPSWERKGVTKTSTCSSSTSPLCSRKVSCDISHYINVHC